ncbi:MAG: hypothetical protein AAGJ28_00265 [Pseudomonadota bacterium]
MLRRRDGNEVDFDAVVLEWRRLTRLWGLRGLLVAIASGSFVAVGDYWPVVLEWLLLPEFERAKLLVHQDPSLKIGFVHPQAEFDWSVASTFDKAPLSTFSNALFGLFAYLLIPIFGMSIVFGGFVYLCAFAHLFDSMLRNRLDVFIIPDVSSRDDRCGFERFENFFQHFLVSAICTAIMSLCMHLQNVYLRSDRYTNIFEMTFEKSIEFVGKGTKNGLEDVKNLLTSINDVIEIPRFVVSIQTFAAPVIIFLVSLLIFACLWAWLRSAALDGRRYLIQNESLHDLELEKLHRMIIWPVGWMTVNRLIAVIITLGLSMFFVNLI